MDNTNTLLKELENLNIDTPRKDNLKTDFELGDTSDNESDEFDEIINRQSCKLPIRGEIPGSSPRPTAQSPFLSEDDDWECGRCPPGQRLGPIGQDNDEIEIQVKSKMIPSL